ncbi:hypothetical protein NCCP2716_26080 [Sporosarcina sp. NCCP-2716]|uniref:hypothetical protein n=1 Tax=Sporosarcina sp. NCCP-2716 TaxID=2943679 RepID=UPI00203F9BEC|nr:hypothetical protein [Sporosarcina sp. NCCP-2716]GKV70110.1 hypothetical protein NCCP2716_26080 [Sporosarcina sp. NCCP-2716]
MKSKIALVVSVGFAILFGVLAYVYYEKAYIAEAVMESGIRDTLRDSALFFEKDHYDAAYAEPLYVLNGYVELQRSSFKKGENDQLDFIVRTVKEYGDPVTYQILSADEKEKIADSLRRLADKQPIYVSKEDWSFFYDLKIEKP